MVALTPSKGLCNESQLVLTDICQHVLKCKIITGDACFAGGIVLIPRITLEPLAETLPIPLKRRQFPVHLAFAMTINKSQGQGVKNVGLNLCTLLRHTQTTRVLAGLQEGIQEREREVYIDYSPHTLLEWRS